MTEKTNSEKAIAARGANPTGFDPSKVKITRHVTLPLLKSTVGVARFIRVTSPIFRGKELKGNQTGEGGKQVMEPADLFNVENLEDNNAPGQMIVNAIMKSRFEDEYPEAAYVGKCFSITKLAKRDGKKYNEFEILEIEL